MTYPAITTSEETAELFAALSAAQGEFEAVDKTADNPFFKSKYADLPAVVKAASPILAKHGLSVLQMPGFDGDHDMLTTRVCHKSGQWAEATMRLYPVKSDPQAQGSAITYGRRYAYSAALGIVTEEDDDGNRATSAASRSSSTRTASHPPASSRAQGQTRTRPAPSAPAPSAPAPAAAPGPQTSAAEQAAPKPAGDAASDKQIKMMIALFNNLGYTDRTERLTYCTAVTHRTITTANDLTKREASAVIDELKAEEEQANNPAPAAGEEPF